MDPEQTTDAQEHPGISLREAAHRLGCSPNTIRRRVADGTIPAAQFGRLIRIRPEDLARLYSPRKREA